MKVAGKGVRTAVDKPRKVAEIGLGALSGTGEPEIGANQSVT